MRKTLLVLFLICILTGCSNVALVQNYDQVETSTPVVTEAVSTSEAIKPTNEVPTPTAEAPSPDVDSPAPTEAVNTSASDSKAIRTEGYLHKLATSTDFAGLFNEIGMNIVKNVASYDYICEDNAVISGDLFSTAVYFLEGYLSKAALTKTELPESDDQAAVLICKKADTTYMIRISDRYVIVYDKADYDSVPIAAYSYSKAACETSELRRILFRQKELEKYLTHTNTVIHTTSDKFLKTNTLYSVDLDNDGTEEELYVAFFGCDWNWSWGMAPSITYDAEYTTGEYIYVNKKLIFNRQYAEHPMSEAFALMSFEPVGKQYIITYDDGPSDDPYTIFYMYSNGKIEEAGEICDCLFVKKEVSSVDGDTEMVFTDIDREKVLKDSIRYCATHGLVQMWIENGVCGFDSRGHLVRTGAEYVPVVQDAFDLLVPVYVSENPDGTGEMRLIGAGKIFMDTTDGVKMVHIKAADGSVEGWINAEEPEGNLTDENKGRNLRSDDLFEGNYLAG